MTGQHGQGGVATPPQAPTTSLRSDADIVGASSPSGGAGVWCHAVGVVLGHRPDDVSMADWLVLVQLAWFGDGQTGENIYVELRTLAARCEASPGSIGEAVRRLVAAGAIVRTAGGPRQKTTYALAVGPWRHRAQEPDAVESARCARAQIDKRRARPHRAHVRGPTARTIPTIPLDKSVVELDAVADPPPVDELGRADPVPFEQTATNLHGVTLAKLALHPDAVTALVQLVVFVLTSRPGPGPVPEHLVWTTNKAGPADRRRRRDRVSA